MGLKQQHKIGGKEYYYHVRLIHLRTHAIVVHLNTAVFVADAIRATERGRTMHN